MPHPFTPPQEGRLGLGGIMAAALVMYRAAPWPLVTVALVTALPVTVFVATSELAYGPPVGTSAESLRTLVQLLPAALLAPISTAATTVIAIDLLRGRPTSASRALESVAERFWPMAAVSAITVTGLAVGLFALIIPGLILLILWLFAAQVVLLERRGVREAFRRSVALVRGAFWWTLGGFLAISLTVGLAAKLVESLTGQGTDRLSGDVRIAGAAVVTLAVSTVLQPVANLCFALMYAERHLASEGRWPHPMRHAEAPA